MSPQCNHNIMYTCVAGAKHIVMQFTPTQGLLFFTTISYLSTVCSKLFPHRFDCSQVALGCCTFLVVDSRENRVSQWQRQMVWLMLSPTAATSWKKTEPSAVTPASAMHAHRPIPGPRVWMVIHQPRNIIPPRPTSAAALAEGRDAKRSRKAIAHAVAAKL